MDAGTEYLDLTLKTPINGTHGWTFGFDRQLVNAECVQRVGLCKGIFYGDDPFDFVEPVILLQLSIITLLTNFCQLLFKPLGQTSVIGQLMGAFIAGPSALSRNPVIKEKLFPKPSRYVQETLSLNSSVFIFFLAGVRMDMGTIKHSGKKEWAIGFFSFLVPMFLTIPLALFFKFMLALDEKVHSNVCLVSILMSTTSFHVVASFLYELKLLNSELGRLAMSSSMVSVLLSWITVDIGMTIKQTILKHDGVDVCLKLFMSTGILVVLIFYIIRPTMLWMIQQTEEGRSIKQSYLYVILIMVLGCCFLSEALGIHVSFTAAFLGICVPGGPPLGSALEEKVDCFVTHVLLPLYLLVNFEDVDLYNIRLDSFLILGCLGLLATLGKFLGTLFTGFYFDIPVSEALPLGLVLSTLGLLDLQFYKSAQLLGFIDSNIFGVMSLLVIVITGFIGPVVRVIYNPSRKYKSQWKRTLQYTRRQNELPILVCVYNQENVPALVNLLEASCPSKDHPMAVYLLQLVELVGRAAPLLVPYQPGKNNDSQRSGRAVFNAFKIFERNNPGVNTMQAFTSIAPYATMHDDICTVALEKKVCFIIVPFYKQWHIDGEVESVSRRSVNKNVLMMAPCSVGILIDRGSVTGRRRSILESWVYFRVAMIFLGGADDREALSLAMRMAQHPNVNLLVIRLISIGDCCCLKEEKERILDEDVITDFRLATINSSDRVLYKDVGVADGVGTINVIRSMDNSCDLILVGRRHDKDSPFLEGSIDWLEFPDVGFIADMLISADLKSRFSILVVQQHDLQSQAPMGKSRLDHIYSRDLP